MIALLLGFLYGLGRSIRDTIEHHWENSTFKICLKDHYECYKWMESKEKANVPMFLWFLYDGKHFFDFIHMVSGILFLIFTKFFGITWIEIIVFILMAALTFLYTYKFAFVRKS